MYDYNLPSMSLAFMLLLGQTYHAAYESIRRKLLKKGFSIERVRILGACKYSSGPLTPAQISRMRFHRSSSTVELLARMEKSRLIKRVPKQKGHPFTEVALTPKGEKYLSRATQLVFNTWEETISSLYPEEISQMQHILRKMREKALKQLRVKTVPAPNSLIDLVTTQYKIEVRWHRQRDEVA